MSETQQAQIAGVGNVIVQIVGDGNTVVSGHPYLWLTRYAARRLGDADVAEVGEARLLSPYALAAPMLGRAPVLERLWAWLENGRPISVKVLIATAGRGKTRLALELSEAATGKGWAAGFATSRELARFQAQENLAAWGWRKPTLVVVDYAASDAARINAWLSELADHPVLAEPATGGEKPLRLLLLERQAEPSGGWWLEAFGRGGGDAEAIQDLLADDGPERLPEIEGRETRRRIVAEILQRAGSSLQPPETGQDDYFDAKLAELSWGGDPLFLSMAGLTAAHVGFNAVLALGRDDLAFRLAERELARIGRLAAARGVPEAFLAHMAALATLCQGLDRSAAFAAIEREKAALGHDGAGDRATVFAALRGALPQPDADAVLPILPDVIGEAVLLRTWSGDAGGEGIEPVLRAVADARPAVVATVIRACQDFAIHGHAAPLRWLAALGEAAAQELPLLLDLLGRLPQHTLVLRELASELTETATDALRAQAERSGEPSDRAMLATALNNLSNRLGDLGRRGEALAAIEEAVTLYRALAAARPDAFRPDLASSLNNLSAHLSDLGRREEALAAGEEAVALRRALAAARPDAFRPDLAMSLNNLSNRLSDLGRREEALAAIEEAVALRRELAAARPDAFRPDLAMSLGARGAVLRASDRTSDAAASFAEGLSTIGPMFLALPQAHAPLVLQLLQAYGQALEQASLKPEEELLGPILEKLREIGTLGGPDGEGTEE